MVMSQSPVPDPVRLPADLGLGAAEPLRAALVAAIDGGGALVLDGAAVERVSTACLQVLVAAARAAAAAGLAFRITDPTPVLSGAVADLALQDALSPGE